ncbi:MAG: hypothetical protein HOO67_00270 [Candidatus Peribacteraceae bacterium]|nr:hypothetical protein [Candidatus Peribacteraceae bacterium]
MASFRSPNTPAGLFSTLATTHIHIDGAPFEGTKKIVEWFAAWGIRGKVDRVLECIGGPQRLGFPELYAHHTAGENDKEDFGCFSTMLLDDKPQECQRAIQLLFQDVEKFPGAVVEAEESFARIDSRGSWHEEEPGQRRLAINPKEFGFYVPPQHSSIEVHHSVDVEKFGNEPSPLVLPEMMEALGDKLDLGGLFRFEKNEAHAIRSNSFASPDGIRARVEEQHRALQEFLAGTLRGRTYTVKALVERVIGVKHMR